MTLWTPEGEHQPEGGPTAPPPEPTEEERAAHEEFARAREELRRTPVRDLVANHAIGLWQLAVLHLGVEDGVEPDLEEARLAVDALAALVEGMGERLGDHGPPLQEALANLRLAYVQVAGSGES